MIHGFEKNLTCEGIIGDGCGGGRLFGIKNNKLEAYDPQTQESILLLENVYGVKAISKKGCSIFVTCKDENIEFDLSKMKRI